MHIMVMHKQRNPRQYLEQCRAELKSAQESGNEHEVSTALVDLGFALFQTKKYEEGAARLDEAVELSSKLQDVQLQANVLGIKTLAYQLAGRLPDAFTTAGEVLRLGEEHNDPGLKCDALASQGQILLDSGEPIIAFEKLQAARKIADETQDTRRLMNVLGAMGNYCIAITSLDQAEAYFGKAFGLATSLGDRRAQTGFCGNQAAVLSWKGEDARAVVLFEQVLDWVREQNNTEATLQALRHLVKSYAKLRNDDKVLEYAGYGIQLAEGLDDEAELDLYEAIISVYYRTESYEQAHAATQKAIVLCERINNRSKEVDLLLGLGESQFLLDQLDAAFSTYQKARLGAGELGRKKDEAYLTGRLGITLAEMGRLEEAIGYHHQAAELARQGLIHDLEGEQFTMLAMVYYEKGEIQKAQEYCNSAIQVYSDAGLNEEVQKAVQLLEKIGT
jgi:tetratricopeptide (TPR) repeat protein